MAASFRRKNLPSTVPQRWCKCCKAREVLFTAVIMLTCDRSCVWSFGLRWFSGRHEQSCFCNHEFHCWRGCVLVPNCRAVTAYNIRTDVDGCSLFGFSCRTGSVLVCDDSPQETWRRAIFKPVCIGRRMAKWPLIHDDRCRYTNARHASRLQGTRIRLRLDTQSISGLHVIPVCRAGQCLRAGIGHHSHDCLPRWDGKEPLADSSRLEVVA